jgi:hypothetical protein
MAFRRPCVRPVCPPLPSPGPLPYRWPSPSIRLFAVVCGYLAAVVVTPVLARLCVIGEICGQAVSVAVPLARSVVISADLWSTMPCETNPIRHNSPAGKAIQPATGAGSVGRPFPGLPAGSCAALHHLRTQAVAAPLALALVPFRGPSLCRLRRLRTQAVAVAVPLVRSVVSCGDLWFTSRLRNEPNRRRVQRHPERGHPADRGTSTARPRPTPEPPKGDCETNPIRQKPPPCKTMQRGRQPTPCHPRLKPPVLRNEPNRRRVRRHPERGHPADRGTSTARRRATPRAAQARLRNEPKSSQTAL